MAPELAAAADGQELSAEEELTYLLPGFSVQSGLRAGRKFDPDPQLPSSPGENSTEEEIEAFNLEVSPSFKWENCS